MTKINTYDMYEHILQSNMIENVSGTREIATSLFAWKYLVTCNTVSKQTILNVHAMIMNNLLPCSSIGTWRKLNVLINGSTNNPPHFLLIEELMELWVKDFQSYQDLNPLSTHVQFENIHPFVDGNGRVGRMLMWWHEVKLGEEPTLIRDEDKSNYYKWFKSSSR